MLACFYRSSSKTDVIIYIKLMDLGNSILKQMVDVRWCFAQSANISSVLPFWNDIWTVSIWICSSLPYVMLWDESAMKDIEILCTMLNTTINLPLLWLHYISSETAVPSSLSLTQAR